MIKKNITVIGSGSWGTAIAIHLGNLGHNVKIWSFAQDEADIINNERKCKFLPLATIPDNVSCTTDIKEAVEGSEIIYHVTPSKFFRSILVQYKDYIKDQVVVICSKGFEKDSLKTLDEVLKEEVPNVKMAVLSGPSHAEEVSLAVPTAMVVAAEDDKIADDLQHSFMNKNMRVYTTDDIRGVELGGALKNIIAFCAGIAVGLNLGDNTFAALLTRGLTEISRLGIALGGKKDTFYGLTGLGDLVVTCASEHSRNRKAGKLTGLGMPLDEVRKEVGMVIESIDNIEVAYELAKLHKVETPIITTVYKVLYNGLDPKTAVIQLMTRTEKSE